MANTSNDEQLLLPDGTTLVIRTFGKKSSTGVVVFPDVGESVSDAFLDKLAHLLSAEGVTVHFVELRGHGHSRGTWSLNAFRVDLTFLLAKYRELYDQLIAVGLGISGSTLLEYDDQAHRFKGNFPPLPDGMLILAPLFRGSEILPELGNISKLTKKVAPLSSSVISQAFGKGFGSCRLNKKDIVQFWNDLNRYSLHPVRIQTPTELLVPMDEIADPLKRIFGSVAIRKVTWLHREQRHASTAEIANHAKMIHDAFNRIRKAERPIRFRNEQVRR